MQTIVARFTTVGEAEAARSALDAAGIPCRLGDENTIAVQWLYSNAIGGVKVVVAEGDREDVLEVLRNASEQAPPEAVDELEASDGEEPSPEQEDPPCPACGSMARRRIPRLRVFAALAVIAVGVGAAVEEPNLALALIVGVAVALAITPAVRCANCGQRFTQAGRRVVKIPLPEAEDVVDAHCERCGSVEVHRAIWRRFGAFSLLPFFPMFFLAPFWIVLPKWKCDQCGRRTWVRPRIG
jgi:hypothetical protein